MNKSILFAFSFLLFSFMGNLHSSTTNVLIKGKITNSEEKEILLHFHDPLIPNVDPVKKVVPVIDGSFLYETKIDNPVMVSLRVGNENFSFYIEPGDQLQINFDSESFLETLRFEGKGAANNNYLIDFKNKFFPKNFDFGNFIKDKDAIGFKNHFEDQRQAQKEFYKSREKELSPHFRKVASGSIDSYYAANILKYPGFYYPGLWKTFNGIPSDLPEDFYDGIKNINVQNDDLLPIQNYREYIIAFVELNHKKRKVQDEYYDLKKIVDDKTQIVKENFNGSTRDFLIAAYLMNLVTAESLDKASLAYENLKPVVSNKDVLVPVEKAIEKFQSVLPGQPAPHFELKDLGANNFSLADFRGQVIFIDFWASWCVPCLEEVPSAEKLKEYYKERDDLIFLYISLDDKEENWRDIIQNKDLKGLHLLSQGWRSEVADKYNISSIPRYYLIDKNGRIANQNAPRPSDEEIFPEIDRVLKIPLEESPDTKE